MLPSSEWLYLGANTVWASEPRLTIPACIFDEYAILDRDQGGWWIYDKDAKAIQISNRTPNNIPEVAEFAKLSSVGDGSTTRFFTIPKIFRDQGNTESESSRNIPQEIRLDHEITLHFISATALTSNNRRSLYLFTLDQLEDRVTDTSVWENDPKSLSRLLDSEANHLIDVEKIDSQKPAAGDTKPPKRETHLSDRLNIHQGEVPNGFTIKRTTIEIEDIPPSIYSNIDLKYLLVRYGTSEQTKQNSAEDPEITQILNKVVDATTTYSEQDRVIEAEIPFSIHDRHAAEFKLFVDVTDPEMLKEVKMVFANSPSCSSASISDSLEDRVYMVHKRFLTTETSGGFINNVIYPE